MITWNIDLSNYTQKQLEDLLFIVEQMDTSIATEISDYLNEFFYKYGKILFSEVNKDSNQA